MSLLSRDQQIQVVGCLTEGLSIRAIERLTGIHRDTIMRLGARVGRGCVEMHDRMMVGLRVGRIEMDELWAFVGKKQKHLKRTDSREKGDQYTFVALASSSRAIIAYRTGKRQGDTTDQFVQDLRERVIGSPEISTDGFRPYQPAIRDAFENSAARHHQQDFQRYAPSPHGSGAPSLLARSSYRSRAGGGARRAGADQHILCGTQQSFDPHGVTAFYPADQWFQQKAGQPLLADKPLCRPLQSMPRSRKPADYAGSTTWDHRSCGRLAI